MPLRTLLLLVLLSLTACGGNKSNQGELSYTGIELLDPTPGSYNGFGESIYLLSNSNIVVTSAYDSSIVPSNGAIHLYDPTSGALINSIYGATAYERFGREKIIPLDNGNFFIASPNYSEGMLKDVGVVYLVNGATGDIIASLYGDQENNLLGKSYPGNFIRYSNDGFSFNVDMEGVSILANNNVVIRASSNDFARGSATLINSNTGEQISSPFFWDYNPVARNDDTSILPLPNGNFVISNPYDNSLGSEFGGSLNLFDGETAQLINSFYGVEYTRVGSYGTYILPNGNYVVGSEESNRKGSVRIFDGFSGEQIGAMIEGESGDTLTDNGALLLDGNNFLISSYDGLDIYSKIVDGSSGAIINTHYFDTSSGGFDYKLPNGNVLVFISTDIPSTPDEYLWESSAYLLSGQTGEQINTLRASNYNRYFSFSEYLSNSNVLIREGGDENDEYHLLSGTTGEIIKRSIVSQKIDGYYQTPQIFPLSTGNVLINLQILSPSSSDFTNSTQLYSGLTGEKIGQPVILTTSEGPGVYILNSGNYLITSFQKEEDGVYHLYSTLLIDGETGKEIAALSFEKSDTQVEQISAPSVKSLKNSKILYSFQLKNTVHTYIVDGTTGSYRELTTFSTELTDAGPSVSITLESDKSDFFVLSFPYNVNLKEGAGVFGKVTLFRNND